MNEQFIPFELAVKLKELGFNEYCLAYFKDGDFRIPNPHEPFINSEVKPWIICAPLWQQAFDWFKMMHDIDLCIRPMTMVGYVMYYTVELLEAGKAWDPPVTLNIQDYAFLNHDCLEAMIKIVEERINKKNKHWKEI